MPPAPPAALFALLLSDLAADGPRRPAAAAFASACEAGEALACALRALPDPLPARWVAARALAEGACASGVPEGCVAAAVLTVREPLGGLRVDLPAADRQAARRRFADACSAGAARACAELAGLHRAGFGTYRSPARGDALAARACALGDAGACRPPSPPALPTEAAGACALGDVGGCIRAAAEAGSPAEAFLLAADAWCAIAAEGCREAARLRAGLPLAVAQGHYTDPEYVHRALFDALPAVRACHVASFVAGSPPPPVLDLWVRVDASGVVRGVVGPTDPAFASCVDRGVRGFRMGRPLEGLADVRARIPLRAAAVVTVAGIATDADDGVGPELARRWTARGEAFDACVLANEPPLGVEDAAFSATVRADGTVGALRWDDPDLRPGTLACLEGLLAGPTDLRTDASRDLTGVVHFFAERGYGPGPWLEPFAPEGPFPVRVTSVIPAFVEVEGERAPAPGLPERVAEAQARVAARVREWSHGAVELVFTPVSWSGTLRGVTVFDDGDLRRARLTATELPDAVVARIPAGSADVLLAWAPVAGVPVGLTSRDTARGARLSIVPVDDGDLAPRLLHALWSQLRLRAADRLGAALPSPEEALLLDGEVLDPAWWLADGPLDAAGSGLRPLQPDASRLALRYASDVVGRRAGDPLPFYAAMFGKVLHPAILDDLARADAAERTRPTPALAGLVVAEGTRDAERAVDGRIGDATLRTAEPARDRARLVEAEAWVGVTWPVARPVTGAEAWLARPGEPASADEVAFDVRQDGVWTEVGRARPEGARARVELARPLRAEAVRVRVTHASPDRDPECLELLVDG